MVRLAEELVASATDRGLALTGEGGLLTELTPTPVRDGTGPARLLDIVEGRSKQAFKAWLAERDEAFRGAVEVDAMDGFTGFKDDPLYKSRRTLHTGADLLTDKQADRLRALLADDAHVEVEASWGVYQRMIAAYRHEDHRQGRDLMVNLIDSITSGVPKALVETTTLGRTLKKRAADVLAYFDRPGTSNGPMEAINGRLEHLRGSALGFRNLTNYIARSLLKTSGFRPQLHPGS